MSSTTTMLEYSRVSSSTPDAGPEEASRDERAPRRIDLERLARLVYQLLLNDLTIGRERGR
jgi:hypothetical protein